MITIIIVAVIAAVLLWGVTIYNGLIRRKNIVAEAWSGIETQLKRRADLIPNLVETVKGYATHERTTFDELARLRSAGQGAQSVAERAQTEQAISAAIGKIMAVAEAYPELKASANFQSLQGDLSGIEEQINLSRRFYNGAVRDFNVMIEQFPSNLVANMGSFKPAAFFQIENAADRDVPKVSFAS
ncbi:MAG: LemA family protein [Alphaproteobacteria bacterium]|nr:LemA family protein [Alphaproteobacteria bacterium]